ncbi:MULTISPECIES: 1-phosphofructokinase family hexose kinase [Mycobacterium]|uniref:ATP-dependent 6-phosphofructokinase isozyme 2 n=1 Tax=Mycobacterium kiyosense TaxID=2871094 RepID=A0A9P3UZ48_9MYCO|nr:MULTISPECIES: 1-phosphofructokinase family hexose kinase [Mycobacterium]BDB41856.1 putative ATP-dependent 6-phosphofructokinase isozyme 2 [Mycobacterium kiyosense]BDE14851.1 putative ATP-dependent 6-phosphofructokinase isozyme 2 [Mycobacterium sp. 20KCMC460]GLB82225.1 putative ATP-dependent 6-phosphofructokinase isozyme 2 [Mycobacterium kiyosense]GLB89275.1 putative ATP-dependent 6-phosphofructokinase isozyme 2 [Mycobacterium kiyosense]GLB95929.1 putative ATP-dependent 6-phosphofructokinase
MGMPAGPLAGLPQIVTLTMNPAIDVTTAVGVVRPTEKLRCSSTRYDPGGGGVNVARIARVLGGSVFAVFPAGGSTGGLLTSLLSEEEVPFAEIPITAAIRESFTVNESSTGRQYRFVLPGPQLSDREQARCLQELRMAARSAQFVVASGSLPPGVPDDFYDRVAELCHGVGASLILDTSGAALECVSSGVFLLKVSVRELRECVGRELLTETDQLEAAQELIALGRAQAVVVSLGSHGALLATAREGLRFAAVPMAAGSGVGAGDAMVAGITVGLSRGCALPEAVRLGIAAGAAMLLTPGTAPCSAADVNRLLELAAQPFDIARVGVSGGAERPLPK